MKERQTSTQSRKRTQSLMRRALVKKNSRRHGQLVGKPKANRMRRRSTAAGKDLEKDQRIRRQVQVQPPTRGRSIPHAPAVGKCVTGKETCNARMFKVAATNHTRRRRMELISHRLWRATTTIKTPRFGYHRFYIIAYLLPTIYYLLNAMLLYDSCLLPLHTACFTYLATLYLLAICSYYHIVTTHTIRF